MKYDQRNVRREEDQFRILGANNLCDACGANERCALALALSSPVTRCTHYLPVIGFKSSKGLDRLSNTFRRGAGIFNRVREGMRVGLFVDDRQGERLVGHGVVTARYLAPLGELLDQHAAINHLFVDQRPQQAPALLKRVLEQMYGRNYASDDTRFSAVYVQPEV